MNRYGQLLHALKSFWKGLRRRSEGSRSANHEQIARSRIAEAKANNAVALDLGDLEIERLPREISTLHKLSILALGSHVHCFAGQGNDLATNLRWQARTERPGRRLKNISALAALENLQALSLAGCVNLSHFDVLQRLPKLRSLDLCGVQIGSAPWLAKISCLEALNLDCAKFDCPESFNELPHLKRLQISNNDRLKDLSFLGSNSNLEWLNLWACWELSDVSHLRRVKNLRGLVLDQCHSLIDTTPVSECTELERLSFCMCLRTFERLPDFAELHKLRQLNLYGCPALKDFEGIRNTISLNWLNIEMSQMPTSVLERLTNLNSLFMDRRTEFEVVAEMTRLQELSVHRSPELGRISPVKSLTEIRRLDLSGNTGVNDWSPLRELTALESLDVSNSSFKDLSIVDALRCLRRLNLQGCDSLERVDLLAPMLTGLLELGITDQSWRRDLSDSPIAEIDSVFHW